MRHLFWALLVLIRYDAPTAGAAAVQAGGTAPLLAIRMADGEGYWVRNGFVPMTPPIRLPSGDGAEQIRVWIRIPDDASIRVVPRPGGEPAIELPPGTIVDRADLSDGRDPASVQDVRGTRLGAQRDQYFHVLRPSGGTGLTGFEWPRADPIASRAATTAMLDRLAGPADAQSRGMGTSNAGLERFERQNACASCHAYDKPERRQGRGGDGLPNRATDASGFYTIASVLADSAPLETHRARDMNEGDPYVVVTCLDGRDAQLARRGMGRRFGCDDGSVPHATLDVRRALDHGDERAMAVCASRGYLARHLTAEGRAVFAGVLAECGP